MQTQYDVVVVGGGAAGLSGALTLARAGRSVLVVDAGEPRNAPASHVHSHLGREGTPPGELYATGRAEVTGYGGEIVTGRVTGVGRREDGGFDVGLDDGRGVAARRLLVTTGLVDELPEVPGVAQRWGREVLHCPYCHGHEVRDQPIGVLATTALGAHQALLWRGWSADVTLFLHDAPAPTDEESEQLTARGIAVVEGRVAALEVTGDRLTGVRLADGTVVPRAAVVVAPRFTARGDLLAALGLEPVEQRTGDVVVGTVVPADPQGATAVPGVWVAGNVADLRAQVTTAAARGLEAAAAVNADLIAEDTRRAVADHRHHAATVFDEDSWEERYRGAPELWSGRPNLQLLAEVADLPPGRALDAGSGEGGDALWLAGRGWQVTAVDFSTVALTRGAAEADRLGPEVADRVDWVHADLTRWAPPPAAFDLVSAQFLHLPAHDRAPLLARLAAAVVPGGTLLVVGHVPSELHTSPGAPDMFFTAGQVAASLDRRGWDVVVCEARPRTATGPDGREVAVADAVLRARRREG